MGVKVVYLSLGWMTRMVASVVAMLFSIPIPIGIGVVVEASGAEEPVAGAGAGARSAFSFFIFRLAIPIIFANVDLAHLTCSSGVASRNHKG